MLLLSTQFASIQLIKNCNKFENVKRKYKVFFK